MGRRNADLRRCVASLRSFLGPRSQALDSLYEPAPLAVMNRISVRVIQGPVVAFLLVLGAMSPAAVHGQDQFGAAADSAEARVSAAQLLLPAMIGSALGTVGGYYAGGELGWGGGDDPGLTGAVFGAALASTLATTAFIVMTADGRIPPEGAWGPSAVGAMGGVAAALLALSITDSSSEALVFVISYSVAQGAIASLLAAANQ